MVHFRDKSARRLMLMIYLCQDINKTPNNPKQPSFKWHVGQNSCYLYKLTGSTWTTYGNNQSQYLMCANGCVQWEAGLCICLQQACVGAMIVFPEIRRQWTSGFNFFSWCGRIRHFTQCILVVNLCFPN